MENNLNLYQRIFLAKKHIASQTTKKSGKNDFSKYDYFKPEQVDALVLGACEVAGIDFHFDLLEDSFGLFGQLSIVNIDNPQETITYTQRSAIPEIKATNRTQQYGGAMTYTRRYMLQSAFCIADNKLDFDHDNGLHNNISDTQLKELTGIVKDNNIDPNKVKELIKSRGIESARKIPKDLYPSIKELILNLATNLYPE